MSSASHDDEYEQLEGSLNSLFHSATDAGNDDDSNIDCQVENTLRTILLQPEEPQDDSDNSPVVDGEEEQSSTSNSNVRKKRRPKRTAMWTDQDGSRRPILPRQTFWYSVYVSAPDLENPQFHQLFRLRFRLPYAQFRQLNDRLETEASFLRWHDGKINPWSRVQSTPISLLLLTSLHYLGRGWTFDDLSENTSISEETICVFSTPSSILEVQCCTDSMYDHLQIAKRQAHILLSTKWQASQERLGVLMQLTSCSNVCRIVSDKHTLVLRCLTQHGRTISQLTIAGRFLPQHLDIQHVGTTKPWLCLITS